MNKIKQSFNKRAFTLIEMLLVLLIISLLLILIIPNIAITSPLFIVMVDPDLHFF